MQARRPLRGWKGKRGVIRHRAYLPPFAGAQFEHMGRISPERFGEGIAQVCAVEPDIGEHAGVETSQDACLTPIPEETGKPSGQCEQRLHGIPPKRETVDVAPELVRRHPKAPPDFNDGRNMALPD